jgi:hypothetical protein
VDAPTVSPEGCCSYNRAFYAATDAPRVSEGKRNCSAGDQTGTAPPPSHGKYALAPTMHRHSCQICGGRFSASCHPQLCPMPPRGVKVWNLLLQVIFVTFIFDWPFCNTAFLPPYMHSLWGSPMTPSSKYVYIFSSGYRLGSQADLGTPWFLACRLLPFKK